jgi:hypothetical protein
MEAGRRFTERLYFDDWQNFGLASVFLQDWAEWITRQRESVYGSVCYGHYDSKNVFNTDII